MLAEYGSLRQESLQAIGNRIQIMNFGFTSLSIITAGVLSAKIPNQLLAPICLLFIPIAAKSCIMILLGEYHRSQRAGHGVRRIEGRINQLLDDENCLKWEDNGFKHMRYPYYATAGFILSVSFLGDFLGFYFMESAPLRVGLLWCGLTLGVALTTELAFILFLLRRLRAIRIEVPPGLAPVLPLQQGL